MSPPTDFIASIPVRTNRNGAGAQYYPVFNIMRSHLEKQMGKKLTPGRFYHIAGRIEGAFEFDIHRVVKGYIRMVTPLEHRDRVEFGKVYSVRIRLIEEVLLNEKQRNIVANAIGVQYRPLMYRLRHAVEPGAKCELQTSVVERATDHEDDGTNVPMRLEDIGAAFALKARLHTKSDNRRYFTLPNAAFEQKTGLKIEEMRDYLIKGEIQGMGEFRKVLQRCAARQDIPIYCSARLSKNITVGREYVVKVDSVEKLVRPKPWEGIKLDGLEPWAWKEVASWVDTEGAICCPSDKGGNYQILISQKEKKVLAEIARFLDQHGIRFAMNLTKSTGVYNLRILGADNAARVVKEIEPFIRTENKIVQISNFKKSICKPRKRLWPSIRDAREILGLTNKAA